eukprot:9470679-Pyramimonas_sp.AAC.1
MNLRISRQTEPQTRERNWARAAMNYEGVDVMEANISRRNRQRRVQWQTNRSSTLPLMQGRLRSRGPTALSSSSLRPVGAMTLSRPKTLWPV